MVERYLLDTNAYFAILKYICTEEEGNITIERILKGKCYISKATQIEIISVIGKYARGSSGGVQICDRVHEGSVEKCGKKYIVKKQKKWSSAKVREWIKLEKEVSSGINSLFNVSILELNEATINEAEKFIQNALIYNFKSMDSIIVGTALANSSEQDKMIVVTADKALKAGMDAIDFPHVSVN